MKVGILIQARISSTRLPGKVLFNLGNTQFNSLHLLYKRLSKKKITNFAKIVFLTSNNKCDDVIEYFCKSQEYPVFRGEEQDVLDRYYQAACKYKFDQIIRLTSDCPLVDPQEILRVYSIHNLKQNDYTTNSFEGSSIVDGCDVEVFNFRSFKKVHSLARSARDREHVTPYFSKENGFICSNEDPGLIYPYTRLTLDTPEDFRVISEILNRINDPINIGIEELAKIYNEEEYSKYNNFIKRNSGWDKKKTQ